MYKVLPLVAAICSLSAVANSYSNSDKRTIEAAVSSILHSQEIASFNQRCKEQPKGTVLDNNTKQLNSLLQAKLATDDYQLLLKAANRITEVAENKLIKPKDCNDAKGFQSLLDSYEVALFSLDLAFPLEKPLTSQSTSNKSRSNVAQGEVQNLISRSNAIALVNVVDKQLLSPIQQANFLHPDYNGRYIFKTQQGWQGIVPHYLGMHIILSEADIANTTKQWLIFLDKNGHFIKAIPAYKASSYTKQLNDAHWRYDVHGNLLKQ